MADLPRLTPAREAARTARERRRAQALRDNLRRRKEQARARDAEPPEPSGEAPASDTPAA